MDDGIGVSYSTEFPFRCEGGHRSCEQCFRPSDLAGCGVIELIRADARIFPARVELFLPGSSGGFRHAGAFGSVPLRNSSERVGPQLSKAAGVLTAPFWATGAIKGYSPFRLRQLAPSQTRLFLPLP